MYLLVTGAGLLALLGMIIFHLWGWKWKFLCEAITGGQHSHLQPLLSKHRPHVTTAPKPQYIFFLFTCCMLLIFYVVAEH